MIKCTKNSKQIHVGKLRRDYQVTNMKQWRPLAARTEEKKNKYSKAGAGYLNANERERERWIGNVGVEAALVFSIFFLPR